MTTSDANHETSHEDGHEAGHAAPPPARDDVRISVVTGDRLCARCGYNLTGQTVLRERHYGLLIVRCPECATAASIQEYPVLGRWANRWGAVLAVLWFVLLLGMWLASGAATFGWSVGIAEDASRPYVNHLQALMAAEQAQQAATQTPGGTVITGTGTPIQTITWGPQFVTWWNKQDPAALFAGAGGWRGVPNWSSLVLLMPGSIASFAFGMFWSVALLRMRRRWLFLWGLCVIALASLFAGVSIADWMTGSPNWTWDAARRQIGPPLLIGSIAFSCIPLSLGLYFGRPLTRVALRLLLPPGLRGTLSVLWTAEGLEPPLTTTRR